MKTVNQPSLKHSLRKVSLKWASIGLLMSFFAGFACLLYSSKLASESEARTLSESLARAFRQQILQGDVRDAQFQMNFVLGESADRSVRVLDTNRNEIYPMPDDKTIACKKFDLSCWRGITHIDYLKPIYFDDDGKQGLYGYLSLSINPKISWPIVTAFAGFILLMFAIQAFGLLSALNDISKMILSPLSSWAEHLSAKPNSPVDSSLKPKFTEFQKMDDAVSGLYLTIVKLEEEAAQRAMDEAKASIIREVGHDLKTPLSQLSKHFHLLIYEVAETKGISQSRIQGIEKAMASMGNLIRQIKLVHDEIPVSEKTEITDLVQVAREYTESLLELDSDVKRKRLKISFESAFDRMPITIVKTELYQIIDNLLRNAVESILTLGGKIEVACFLSDSSVFLTVKDTGFGIPREIQDKVFEKDFTTKDGTGTGLGLSIVHRICREYGAKVYFESTDGAGTKFVVEFPKIKSVNQKFEQTKVNEYEA